MSGNKREGGKNGKLQRICYAKMITPLLMHNNRMLSQKDIYKIKIIAKM